MRPAVGPGMIPAVSIYTSQGSGHATCWPCARAGVYSGTRVIVLHRVPDIARAAVFELVG